MLPDMLPDMLGAGGVNAVHRGFAEKRKQDDDL
jgi:hypothetical protein